MTLHQDIENDLNKIHRSRNRIGYLPALLAFFVSCYFQDELPVDQRFILAFGIIFAGTVLRILVGEVFFKQWCAKLKWARLLNLTSFALIGAGWSLHFADVFYHYGSDSKNTFYTLLIISSFITGSSTSLTAHRPSYIIYVTGLSIGVIATYFQGAELSESYIILNIFIFLFFSISNHKVSHQQLLDLLESEKKQKMEKERLALFINAVPGFVGLIDKNSVCYMANHSTLNLYPDIIGNKIGNLDPNSVWEKFVIDFLSSDKTSDVSEQHTIHEGQDIYALLNLQKLNDGGAIVVSIITNDLVEAKKKIKEQEAKAQYSAKLATLGEMAAGIAHEVNNPLTIIQGYAKIIKRQVGVTPIDVTEVQNLADKMIETSERISKTVKSLKALSRNGENDPKEIFAVKDVIEQCLDVSGQRFKQNGVTFFLDIQSDDVKIKGREVQLSQVIMNLINNSIDAVKNTDNRWITLSVRKDDQFVNIDVKDAGQGIKKDIQHKIMDPFFTTKDVNQGTGLGLSISKNIVQDHHGDLLLLTEEKNTTFRIRLPLA